LTSIDNSDRTASALAPTEEMPPTPEWTNTAMGKPVQGHSIREAMTRLKSAQKPSKGAPAYSRFVNRRAGRVLAAMAYRLGMTPNMVTAVSALFSFAAIALLTVGEPSWTMGILVTLGLVIGYALDSADGQLARLRGGGTPSGEWLDHMVDATKITSLHLAVLISAYRFFGLPSEAWLLIPIGFTVVANVSFFGMILNEQLQRGHARETGTPVQTGKASTLRSLLVLPTDYGLLCLVFVLLGSPAVFLGAYGLLFAGSAGYLLLAVVKWFRVMKGLDVRPSRVSTAGSTEPTIPQGTIS
jgi:phosphatidylglycerophosphate synthase